MNQNIKTIDAVFGVFPKSNLKKVTLPKSKKPWISKKTAIVVGTLTLLVILLTIKQTNHNHEN